jgi:hypothetical protein
MANHRAEVDFQSVRNAKQRVDGGEAFALFHTHDHRMAEAGARGDFVEGKLLADALFAHRLGKPPHNRFALGRFRHMRFLRDKPFDTGCDNRHNSLKLLLIVNADTNPKGTNS